MRARQLWRLLASAALALAGLAAALPAGAGDPGGSLPPPPAASKSGSSKLDGPLLAVSLAYDAGGLNAAVQEAESRGVGAAAPGLVRVVVESGAARSGDAAAAVQAAGGTVTARYRDLLGADLPVAGLKRLDQEAAVSFIRTPAPRIAEAVSEGAARVEATRWQQAGWSGQGVKIAVVDLGFSGYQSLLGSDLPPSVVTRCFCSDGSDLSGGGERHGTAVAEIVHDMAPDAQLYLVRIASEVDLGNAVDYLNGEGVRVVNHSVGWFLTGGGDGTGTVNDIVGRARDAGILWVNSAGNYGQYYWKGVWSDPDGNGWQNFSGEVETNSFTLAAGRCVQVLLTWNDWPVSRQDYDLYLYNAGHQIVSVSAGIQSGGQPPEEYISYCASAGGAYGVALRSQGAARPVKFRLFVLSASLQFRSAAGSLSSPSDSPKVLAAGAMAYNAQTLETFSSQGPTQDGRTKPDLTAPDGVSTTTYGPGAFFGTSAAAPHTAGAAALVAGRFPALTAAQVQGYLEAAALDYGDAGKDNQYGAGMLRLPNDFGAPGPPARLAFSVQPGAALQFSPFGMQPAVAVLDANGAPAAGATAVSLSLAAGSGAAGALLICVPNTVTAAGGTAAFTDCTIDRAGSGYQLTATAPGLSSMVSAPFNVVAAAGITDAAVTLSDVAPGRTGVTVTAAFTIATALGAQDDVAVVFPAGFAIAGARAVDTPDSGGVTGLRGMSLDGQTIAGQALRTYRLSSLGAAAVAAGSRVRLTIENVTNPAAVGTTAPFTLCTRLATPGSAAGCTPGSPGVVDRGTAPGSAVGQPSPAQLAFGPQPGGSLPGAVWPQQPSVGVLTAGGAIATNATDPVTLAITPGSGPAAAALHCDANPVTPQSGVARFSGCAIDLAGDGYTLTATAGSLTPATSAPFPVGLTGAAKLKREGFSPGLPAVAPSVFTVKLSVLTAAGVPFPVGQPTEVRLTPTAGSGTLGGTVTAALPAGAHAAVFPAVTYSAAESGVMLRAETVSGDALTAVEIGPLTFTAAPDVGLRFDPNPATATLGASPAEVRMVLETGAQQVDAVETRVTFDPAKLRVEDANPDVAGVQIALGPDLTVTLLNRVDNSAGTIHFAAGRAIGTPAPSGTVTVATLKLVGLVEGSWPVTFTPGSQEGGSEGRAFSFGLEDGAVQVVARRLAFTVQPRRGAAGFALGLQPAVSIVDAQGAVVAGENAAEVTLTLAAGSGPAGARLLCAENRKLVAAGVAAFSGCAIDLPGAGYVLEASVPGLAAVQSAPLTVMLAGDTDGDCRVGALDFSRVVTHFGKDAAHADWTRPGVLAFRADLDGDGRVSAADFSLLLARFGDSALSCPSPGGAPAPLRFAADP